MTKDDPSRLVTPYEIGRALREATGTNPGRDKITAAVVELAHRGLLYHYRQCIHSSIGRPREPGWPRR